MKVTNLLTTIQSWNQNQGFNFCCVKHFLEYLLTACRHEKFKDQTCDDKARLLGMHSTT